MPSKERMGGTGLKWTGLGGPPPSKALEGGSRNNSNFSKDFSYANVSQNESWGFWKGVGAPAAFSRAAQGRAQGKEENGPPLIRCL